MTDSGIIVTEADREAYLAFNMLPAKYAAAVRAGDWDHSTGMQAIARHAAQARLEGLRGGMELGIRACSGLVRDLRSEPIQEGLDKTFNLALDSVSGILTSTIAILTSTRGDQK